MSSKRRFDDHSGASSADDSSVFDDHSSDGESDAADSELPSDLQDSSDNEENDSSSEDQRNEEISMSSDESERDSGEESRSQSESEGASSDVLWSKSGQRWSTSEPPKRKTPQANILRQRQGIGRPAAAIQEVKQAFRLFITEEIVLIIVKQTNERARKTISDWMEQNPGKTWKWKETNADEIWAFIGLLILGGVQRSQNEDLNELWSMNNGRPIFRATMSKNRMNSLLRFCRFDDRVTRATRMQDNRLAPISDLWEMFLARLQICYIPGGALTVDEQLIPTRGRCKFRQYMPKKPAKYGIKVFWCCDSETSYPLNGKVYIGREAAAANVSSKTGTKELVETLVKPWVNGGRSVTTDNYFTSVYLANDLLKVQTTLVGTVRKNRPEIPPELASTRQRLAHSSIFCFDGLLTLVSYVPKKGRQVTLLSSMHHDTTVSEEAHKKPEIISYYNKTKGGVDHMDQMVRNYSCRRKINRWPMTFFFNMVDVAGIAAFVIWITKNPAWNERKSHRRRLFLQELGRNLVDSHLNRRRQNPAALQRNVRIAMQSLGFPIVDSTTVVSKAGVKQRCHLCPRVRDRKVVTCCSSCKKACCPDHQEIICRSCLDFSHEGKRKMK